MNKPRRIAMKEKTSRIAFSRNPKYFNSITVWDSPNALQFAIDQLESRNKKYSIERRCNTAVGGDQIRIWSKTFSRNF